MTITKKSAAKKAAEQAAAEQAEDKQKTKIKTTKEMAEDAVPAKAGRQCKYVTPALPETVPHLPAYGSVP